MGKSVFTRSLYAASAKVMNYSSGDTNITRAAEQKAHTTGKLEPLVDPSGFGVIRLSLPRVEKMDDGRYEMSVGCPMPIETRVDTTSSMGGNVDVAMEVLPEAFESFTKVLEGYDIQICTGIFGDVCDRFVLCRPQFEMEAGKIMNQLAMMVPERGGGDFAEDPDIGIFGGAYLCRHYINRIGLKGFDFTVTDAPGRGRVAIDQLQRVYGSDVMKKLSENGIQQQIHSSLELDEIWNDLTDRAHAFVLQVGNSARTTAFWKDIVRERLIILPDTKYLPHVQAAVIGLTQGVLSLTNVEDFLVEMNLKKDLAARIAESVINIPIAAQTQLPNFEKIPVKGDIFEGKPDVWKDENLWPVGHNEPEDLEEEEQDDWL